VRSRAPCTPSPRIMHPGQMIAESCTQVRCVRAGAGHRSRRPGQGTLVKAVQGRPCLPRSWDHPPAAAGGATGRKGRKGAGGGRFCGTAGGRACVRIPATSSRRQELPKHLSHAPSRGGLRHSSGSSDHDSLHFQGGERSGGGEEAERWLWARWGVCISTLASPNTDGPRSRRAHQQRSTLHAGQALTHGAEHLVGQQHAGYQVSVPARLHDHGVSVAKAAQVQAHEGLHVPWVPAVPVSEGPNVEHLVPTGASAAVSRHHRGTWLVAAQVQLEAPRAVPDLQCRGRWEGKV
jgi:hypothetical protein